MALCAFNPESKLSIPPFDPSEMGWFRFRISEWVLISFFAYVAVISPWFPDRPNLSYQVLVVLVGVISLLLALARMEQTRLSKAISVGRDWLPLLLTLVAFREMELFLPKRFEHHYETAWIQWDRLILGDWHIRAAIESFGNLIPFYLEFCYLLVYGLGAYCVAVLYFQHQRRCVDRFLTVYLAGTLTAYALFPYFPSQPPRLVFPEIGAPGVTTWAHHLNLYILSKATIHVGVFPSAHVSSAFSAAWAMFLLLPKKKIFGWALLFYGISVSVATIYGRYHYAADVLAGFGISLIAALVCFFLKRSM